MLPSASKLNDSEPVLPVPPAASATVGYHVSLVSWPKGL
jgi:hypothetical protein